MQLNLSLIMKKLNDMSVTLDVTGIKILILILIGIIIVLIIYITYLKSELKRAIRIARAEMQAKLDRNK